MSSSALTRTIHILLEVDHLVLIINICFGLFQILKTLNDIKLDPIKYILAIIIAISIRNIRDVIFTKNKFFKFIYGEI